MWLTIVFLCSTVHKESAKVIATIYNCISLGVFCRILAIHFPCHFTLNRHWANTSQLHLLKGIPFFCSWQDLIFWKQNSYSFMGENRTVFKMFKIRQWQPLPFSEKEPCSTGIPAFWRVSITFEFADEKSMALGSLRLLIFTLNS